MVNTRRLIRFYRAQFRLSVASELEYKGAVWLWALVGMLQPLVAGFVWIATSESSQERSFFALYFTAGAVFTNLTSVWVMWEYRRRIASGAFSSHLLTPIHPFHRDLCAMLASKVVGLPVVLTGAVLAGAAMGAGLPPSLSGALLGLLALALAIVLRFVVEWLLALAAFWMVRTDGLNSLYFAVVTLLSGAFAPLDRLPGWMRTTSELTPFPYFLGYPLEIFTARATPRNGLHVIMVQLAMILVFGVLGRLTYKRAILRYEGVSS